jgi:hypothetical protein
MMAGRLEAGLAAWIAAEKQAGLTIDAERTPIGGYPFSFKITFRHPHVSGTLGGLLVDWRGGNVEAWVWPFDFRTLHLATAGDHRLVIATAEASVHADALNARVRFDAEGRVSGVSADSAAATILLPGNRTVSFGSGSMSLEAPPAAPRSDRDPLLHFSVSAVALVLPPDIQLPSANPVETITVQGTVNGPMPPAPLRQALADWRDQGGAVQITSFSAAQPPLSVSGSATVALDGDLQPIIAANAAAKGLGPTVDLLAQQKRIAANDVLKLKLFIAATEQNAPDGGKQVTAGITIQNGYLYLGPFKIARVAKIDWP